MDWRELPDLLAVALLASAFASVARRSPTPVSAHWLTGWLLIVIHFAAFMFLPTPGLWGLIATILGLLSLIWAGILFMRASVPYRNETSSLLMFVGLLGSYTIYLCALETDAPAWLLDASAVLLGSFPLVITFSNTRKVHHPVRWFTAGMQFALMVFLLLLQHRPGNGSDLALNAVLFTVYLGCCAHFFLIYRRATAGAFITISGFLAWAFVFVIAPLQEAFYPKMQIESGVWNLPKYVVAVGMILLLLEDQISHNQHLALHDALTGLPNRRLFQDRLTIAVERARRTSSQTALLILDLDHFKQVNDTMGHHAGDLLLQKVAELFGARVRRSDTVARTGGDEFAIILEAPTSREEATRVGLSLLDLLNEPIALNDNIVRVGASLGVAMYPEDAAEIESLCITADLRMYDNKRIRESVRKRPPFEPGGPSSSHPQAGMGITQ